MKKRIKYVFLLFVLVIFCNKVEAFSVSKNNLTITPGNSETIELYANVGDRTVKEISFNFVYYSDYVKATFEPNSSYNCTTVNTGHKFVFDDGKTGSILLGKIVVPVSNDANINSSSARVYNGVAITMDDQRIALDTVVVMVNIEHVVPTTQVITTTSPEINPTTTQVVKTTTTTTTTTTTKARDNKGLLKEINSKIVNINLEDNVFEYTINVSENVEELDLEPIANDDKTKIEISSQKISELSDKKIIINLSNQDIKEKYIINVNIVSKPTIKPIEIDNSEFVQKNGYKGKWVVAIVFLGITLVLSVLLFNSKKK